MNTAEDRAFEIVEKIQNGVTAKVGRWRWSILIRGVIAVVLGLCALFSPGQTMAWLTRLLGAYFIIDAFSGIIGLWKENEKKETPLMLQTVLSLALGLALLVWTGVSAKIFMMIAGIWIIIQGAGLYNDSKKLEKGESRTLMAAIGGVVLTIGLVFLFLQETGIAAISYLIGFSLLIIGGLLIYLANKLRGVRDKIEGFSK